MKISYNLHIQQNALEKIVAKRLNRYAQVQIEYRIVYSMGEYEMVTNIKIENKNARTPELTKTREYQQKGNYGNFYLRYNVDEIGEEKAKEAIKEIMENISGDFEKFINSKPDIIENKTNILNKIKNAIAKTDSLIIHTDYTATAKESCLTLYTEKGDNQILTDKENSAHYQKDYYYDFYLFYGENEMEKEKAREMIKNIGIDFCEFLEHNE